MVERAVRPVSVEVVLVLADNGCGMSLVMIRVRSRSSRRMLPTKHSAIALARGARTGVLMMLIAIAVTTASKAALDFASRSRMKNRKRRLASLKFMVRLPACWVSQAQVGWAVTSRMCTRRVACSITTTAYCRCSVMVSV